MTRAATESKHGMPFFVNIAEVALGVFPNGFADYKVPVGAHGVAQPDDE